MKVTDRIVNELIWINSFTILEQEKLVGYELIDLSLNPTDTENIQDDSMNLVSSMIESKKEKKKKTSPPYS